MATYAGNAGAVYVSTNAVAEVKEFSLEITANTTEGTVMSPADGDDLGWTTNKVTNKSWTASITAFSDDTDTAQVALAPGAEVALNLYPAGNTSAKLYWQGDALITNVSRSVSVDGIVETSFSVVGQGHITQETVA